MSCDPKLFLRLSICCENSSFLALILSKKFALVVRIVPEKKWLVKKLSVSWRIVIEFVNNYLTARRIRTVLLSSENLNYITLRSFVTLEQSYWRNYHPSRDGTRIIAFNHKNSFFVVRVSFGPLSWLYHYHDYITCWKVHDSR